MESTITLWLVEDDLRFADRISTLLTREPDFDLLHHFDSAEAVDAALLLADAPPEPTIALLDYRLPGDNGVALAARLKERFPELGIVMLTSIDTNATVLAALRAGASGYVLKDARFEVVVRAIREVSRGGMLMPPGVADYVRDHFSTVRDETVALTTRELEILDLMANGLVQKQIAERLELSPHTIDSHLRKIYAKLHVSSGIAAVAAALRLNLME